MIRCKKMGREGIEIVMNTLRVKENNTNLIRKNLKKMKNATKQEIADRTGLSVVTVGSVLENLLGTGEVLADKLLPSNGGRPAKSYRYNENFSYALIICVYEKQLKTRFCVSVVNLYGERVWEIESVQEKIHLSTFEPFVEEAKIRFPEIKVLAFGLPGFEFQGRVWINDHEEIKNTELSSYYAEKYGLLTVVENEANAAAMSFASKGMDDQTLVYIYMPTDFSPGAGIVIEGRLHRGVSNFAGEVDNIPLGCAWKKMQDKPFSYVWKNTAKLLLAVISLINPSKVVLFGEFLTEEHLCEVRSFLRKKINPVFLPEIVRTEDFYEDFKNGLAALALELIEKNGKD